MSKSTKSAKPLGLKAAAIAYLKAHKKADGFNCTELVDAVVANKTWKPGAGLTPAATLSAAFLAEMAKGKAAQVKKVSPGHFIYQAPAEVKAKAKKPAAAKKVAKPAIHTPAAEPTAAVA